MAALNKTINKSSMILWLTCAIEALIALVYLFSLPSDPSNAFLAGYSITRLSIAVCLLFGFFICVWMSSFFWITHPRKGIFAAPARLQGTEGSLFFIASLIVLITLFIMVLPPSFLRGARLERLVAPLLWVCVSSVQIALFIFIWFRKKIITTANHLYQLFEKVKADDRVGLALLILSFIIGILIIFFTYYNAGDEGETFLNGWLLSNGKVLYRDIFTNHFPFSYFWVGLITSIFGSSVAIYRMSFLGLRIIVFGSAMATSKNKLEIGLISISWSLIGPLYLGNMLVYYSFNSILIIGAFLIVFSILNGGTSYSKTLGGGAGLIIGLALLNDPLMYLPGVIILLTLSYCGIRQGKSKRERIINALYPLIGPGAILLVFCGYALITSSFIQFIQQGTLFNTTIYSKYSGVTPTISPFIQAIITGFDVGSPLIRAVTDPYYDFVYFELLEGWSFTALFSRLAIISFCLVSIFQKKYFSAVFIYLLGAALYARGAHFFHASTFILFSITAASFILVESITLCFKVWKYGFRGNLRLYKLITTLVIAGIINPMFIWVNYRMVEFWIQKRNELSYPIQFGHWLNDSNHYLSYACGNMDATFLYYPYNPIISYLTKLTPSSRYYNMAPWVAEIGLQETIDSLDNKYAIVYVEKDRDVWGFNTSAYLFDLIDYLDKYYITVEQNLYLSPQQYHFCYPDISQ